MKMFNFSVKCQSFTCLWSLAFQALVFVHKASYLIYSLYAGQYAKIKYQHTPNTIISIKQAFNKYFIITLSGLSSFRLLSGNILRTKTNFQFNDILPNTSLKYHLLLPGRTLHCLLLTALNLNPSASLCVCDTHKKSAVHDIQYIHSAAQPSPLSGCKNTFPKRHVYTHLAVIPHSVQIRSHP